MTERGGPVAHGGWSACSRADFAAAWSALAGRPIAVESEADAETVSNVLVASCDPPTLAASLPAASPVVAGLQLSRRVALRRADDLGHAGPQLRGAVVRWIPGGRTHALVLIEVMGVATDGP